MTRQPPRRWRWCSQQAKPGQVAPRPGEHKKEDLCPSHLVQHQSLLTEHLFSLFALLRTPELLALLCTPRTSLHSPCYHTSRTYLHTMEGQSTPLDAGKPGREAPGHTRTPSARHGGRYSVRKGLGLHSGHHTPSGPNGGPAAPDHQAGRRTPPQYSPRPSRDGFSR